MDFKEIDDLTKELYEKLDITIKRFIQNNKIKLDCKEGCSLCCKTPSRIEILHTEAFYMAKHLKNNLNDKELDKLIKILYENKIKLQNKNLLECAKELTPCPLLINDKCSIYEFRPFVCRLLLSTDYNICLTYNNFKGQPNKLLDTIFDKNIYSDYIKTIKKAKLFCEPLELNDALYMILSQKNLIDDYLAKKDLPFNTLI